MIFFLKGRNPYTLRRNDTSSTRQVSSVYSGTNPCRYWDQQFGN